jgi:hypothetical protein
MSVHVSTREPQRIPLYGVVGEAEDGAGGFIRHVAMCVPEVSKYVMDQLVRVVHMGPPLASDASMRASVFGVVRLSSDECAKIQLWLAEVMEEDRPNRPERSYVVDPYCKWEIDKETGIRRYRRFSCVGFVFACYQEAVGIRLVQVEHEHLPPVSLDTVKEIYGERLDREAKRRRYGLLGDGPFCVVLPGYLFHSLARDDMLVRASPYKASPGDEYWSLETGAADA